MKEKFPSIPNQVNIPPCLPPCTLLRADYGGGWLCFVVCISVIGLLTAIIGDVAAAFGYTVGLTDTMTATTFVALGTSLPGVWAGAEWWVSGWDGCWTNGCLQACVYVCVCVHGWVFTGRVWVIVQQVSEWVNFKMNSSISELIRGESESDVRWRVSQWVFGKVEDDLST